MQIFKKFFGWLYGFLCLVCLCVSSWGAYSAVHRHHGSVPFLFLVPSAVMLIFGAVFGMAWWSTWKEDPSARFWGILASLLNLFIPASSMYFFHARFGKSKYETIVLGLLGLFAYVWSESDDSAHDQFENNDSVEDR